MSKRLTLWIATGFGVGRLPFAPGTWGTLLGVAYAWAISCLSWHGQVVIIIAGLLLAAWLANIAEKSLARKDPQEVVIDEIAAFPLAASLAWGSPWQWTLLVAAFVFFRVADIVKPFPAKQSQRLHGGLGIVVDDVIAAVYAGLGVWVLRWILGQTG